MTKVDPSPGLTPAAGAAQHPPVNREICPALVALQGFLQPPLADVAPGAVGAGWSRRWEGGGWHKVEGAVHKGAVLAYAGCAMADARHIPGTTLQDGDASRCRAAGGRGWHTYTAAAHACVPGAQNTACNTGHTVGYAPNSVADDLNRYLRLHADDDGLCRSAGMCALPTTVSQTTQTLHACRVNNVRCMMVLDCAVNILYRCSTSRCPGQPVSLDKQPIRIAVHTCQHDSMIFVGCDE